MFIKISDRYINLDNVANIIPVTMEAAEPGTLEIEYVGRHHEDWGSTWIVGDDARALSAWLERNSTDVRRG